MAPADRHLAGRDRPARRHRLRGGRSARWSARRCGRRAASRATVAVARRIDSATPVAGCSTRSASAEPARGTRPDAEVPGHEDRVLGGLVAAFVGADRVRGCGRGGSVRPRRKRRSGGASGCAGVHVRRYRPTHRGRCDWSGRTPGTLRGPGSVAQILRARSTPTPSLGKKIAGGLSRQSPSAIHRVSVSIRRIHSLSRGRFHRSTRYLRTYRPIGSRFVL